MNAAVTTAICLIAIMGIEYSPMSMAAMLYAYLYPLEAILALIVLLSLRLLGSYIKQKVSTLTRSWRKYI